MSATAEQIRRLLLIGVGSDVVSYLDDSLEAAVTRCVNRGYTEQALADELGIAWPIRDELADVAYWSGLARWATHRRDAAMRVARDAGCPLRVIGAAAGMSHAGVSVVLRRDP